MKVKNYKLFHESNKLNIGYRNQKSDKLTKTVGQNATEGEGYYLFNTLEDVKSFSFDKSSINIIEVSYKTPRKSIIAPSLNETNSFLFWGESDDLLEPIKESDSDWVKFHKIASQKADASLSPIQSINFSIKELTRLLIDAGYDSVVCEDDFISWIVILDDTLIIDYKNI